MEDNQDSNLDQDWSGVETDFLADKGVATEEKKDDDAGKSDDTGKADDQGADDTAKKGDEVDPDKKSEDAKKDDDSKEDADDKNKSEEVQDDPTIRDQRAIQREIEADTQAMREDIRKEMFSDAPTELVDSDGDPIRTVEDVQKLINPNTQKPFTAEEATAYLFAAQKNLDKEIKEREQQIEKIADVNITIRDETDAIKVKFGDLLAKMPDLRKEIWADYKATLIIDKNTGLIVDAPVSLQRFFERALKPYADYAATLKADADAKAAEAATEAKQEQAAQRKRTQEDREDVHSAGTGKVTDKEEDGWANAAKDYYEN